MKKSFVLLLIIFISHSVIAQNLSATFDKIKLDFLLNENGTPVYSVSFNDKPVIKPSSMGFVLTNNDNFNSSFELIGSDKKSFDTTWQPVWGEVKNIRNHYKRTHCSS